MPSKTDDQAQDTAMSNEATTIAAEKEAEERGFDNGRAHGRGQLGAGYPHTATLRTPFATAHIEVPRAPGTGMKMGPVRLPSPTQTAFYLGLGVLAIAEIVEWPIAAAIGVGTYVAQHSRADTSASQARRGPAARPAARPQQDQPAEA
ncbi:hypothetical protein [Frankia sp. CiP3]|uniref:hypothetical protein n=1 Tax=Frankia sp. CiP3 TaxID=2880971 RepID=UPI001EF6AC1B|nr:hypothetical protein [Frankia sp. CiP3]